MKNRKAIRYINAYIAVNKKLDEKEKEAFDMAISALEKQGWHNARKDPPKRPDGMWDIYCVYTRFDRCGIAKYYAHGKWDGYDEDGDQIGEYEIIAYCNFPGPYTEEDNDGTGIL